MADTGIGALEKVLLERPELILVDLEVLDIDGPRLVAMIRAATPAPLIAFSPPATDQLTVAVLDQGADDHLTRPVSAAELNARVRAVMRRGALTESQDGPIRVGELLLDPSRRKVTLAGRPLSLARREFDLLLALACRPGELVSKKTLLREVWRESDVESDRT